MIKEEKVSAMSEGLLKINGKYYFSSFKEVDKYNERRFFIQSVNMKRLKKDLENGSFSDVFSLLVLPSLDYSCFLKMLSSFAARQPHYDTSILPGI